MNDLLEKISNGEHCYINSYEIFMSYIGTIWVRKDLELEEGYFQIPFDSIDLVLNYIGFEFDEQLSLFN